MQGLVEVITLMLALTGFGVDANKNAPSADAVLAYANLDADVVVHLDIAAVGPRNYKVLAGLPDDPAIKANPELLAMAKKVKANVEGVRGMAKAVAGLDPIHDLTSVTAFVDVVPGVEPAPLVIARGTIPKDFVDKIAKVSGGTTGKVDGRSTVQIDANAFMGTTKDGALVVGPKALVEPRIDDDWKAPARKKGTAWATIASRIDAKPFFLVAAKLDDQAEAFAAKEAGDNFLGDLIGSHDLAILALHHDGVAFHWQDETKAGVERMATLSEGLVELTRAAHVAPRGVAKVILAALDSYRGTSKDLDALIARKADLMKVVDEYTGDGNFKVKVDKNAKAKTLTVRATGKTLSDVVPAAILVPGLVAGLMLRGAEPAMPPPAAATPPAAAPKKTKPAPAKPKGGVKPPAKKR